MRIWKIVSGVFSILLAFFVFFQSSVVGLGNALFQTGEASGTAGAVVAAILLAGGILSIVFRWGSVGGNAATAILFFLGALVGFLMAGRYVDLVLWSIWCLICALLAMVDLAIVVDSGPRDQEEAPVREPSRTYVVMTPQLKEAILERNPLKRNDIIDNMPEEEAKDSLKYILSVMARKRAQ